MPAEHHTLSPLGLFSTAILSLALCYVPFTGLLTPASAPPPCPHSLRHQLQDYGLRSAGRRLGRSSSSSSSSSSGNSNIAMEDRQETTLNIPSLVIFGLLSFLAIRYFFFAPSSSSSSSSQAAYPAGQRSRTRQVSPEKIDLVANMFPQLDRRRIEWDLVRNGGSVQATTEKVLRQGRLDEPPPNFRAQPAPAAGLAAGGAASSAGRGRAAAKAPTHTDLITRYNLSARVTAEQAQQQQQQQQQQQKEDEQQKQEQQNSQAGQKQGWSANKADRQALLRQRRDAMVLAARRKMEARMQDEPKA